MKITTTQHIRIEFDDGSVKELSAQEAKELHLVLKSYLEPKNVMKNAYDAWLKADIKSFNCNTDTINFIKIPTDLNVEVKTVDDNVVTKVDYKNGTIDGKHAASLFC